MKRLPVPPPLVLSRRRPHADGSGVCASRLDYQTLPLRLCADGHSVLGHNGQFSASIVILSEDLRYAQIIRERPGLWSREAVMSRHASAVPWITASASAQALGIYGYRRPGGGGGPPGRGEKEWECRDTLPHSHFNVIFLYFSPFKGNFQNFI